METLEENEWIQKLIGLACVEKRVFFPPEKRLMKEKSYELFEELEW